MRNYHLLIVCTVLCFFALLTACQKEELVEEQIAKKSPIQVDVDKEAKAFFEEHGYRMDMIEDMGDYYLVEGDIMFHKERFFADNKPKNGRTEQARTSSLVSCYEIGHMTVRVDNSIPSSGVDNWRTEVQQAINDWNSLQSAILLVYTTSSTADITVRSDNSDPLPNNVIGSASFPGGGRPGQFININLDFLSNMSVPSGQKRYNMVHELGHAIGFRHTNWQARGESSANHIPGTPTTDANSVMNGGTANFSWNGFSNGDRTAATILHPVRCQSASGSTNVYFHRNNSSISSIYRLNSNGALGNWTHQAFDLGSRSLVQPFFVGSSRYVLYYRYGDARIYSVTSGGQLGSEVYQTSGWSQWDIIEPFQVGSSTYMLFYQYDGTGLIHQMNSNGTLGSSVYSTNNWSQNYDIIQPIIIGSSTYMLFYRDNGTGAIYKMNSNGTLGSRTYYTANWSRFDIIEPFQAGSSSYLLFYQNDGTGLIHKMNSNGTLGNSVYNTNNWSQNYDIIQPYRVGSSTYMLFYRDGGSAAFYAMNSNGTLGSRTYFTTGWSSWDFIE